MKGKCGRWGVMMTVYEGVVMTLVGGGGGGDEMSRPLCGLVYLPPLIPTLPTSSHSCFDSWIVSKSPLPLGLCVTFFGPTLWRTLDLKNLHKKTSVITLSVDVHTTTGGWIFCGSVICVVIVGV